MKGVKQALECYIMSVVLALCIVLMIELHFR